MNFYKINRTVSELEKCPASKERDVEICGAYLNDDLLSFSSRIQAAVNNCITLYPSLKLQRVLEVYKPEDAKATHYKTEYLILKDEESDIYLLVTKYNVKYIWSSFLNTVEELRPKDYQFDQIKDIPVLEDVRLYEECENEFKRSGSFKDESSSVDEGEKQVKDRAIELMIMNGIVGFLISILILAGLVYFNG